MMRIIILISFLLNLNLAFAGQEIKHKILSRLTAFHQIEINNGKLVEKKLNNHKVRQFAIYMIADHSDLLALTKNYAEKEKINLDSFKSEESKLDTLTGEELAKNYMKHEVSIHMSNLALLKKDISQSNDKEFKKLLRNTKNKVERHLNHAKRIEKL